MHPHPLPIESTAAFVFRGQTKEYFKIWIVNLLLTLLTFGIYSAWAKVRRKKFFYEQTQFLNVPFVYHGTPLPILMGRLILLSVVILHQHLQRVDPQFGAWGVLLLVLVLPWLIVRGLCFNHGNSSFCSIHFGFQKNYATAYLLFIVYSLLSGATFGLATPLFAQRMQKFLIQGSRFGPHTFLFQADLALFYRLFLQLFGMFCLMALAAYGLFFSGGIFTKILIFLLLLGFFAYTSTAFFNLIWNHIQLNGHRFLAHMNANILFILLCQNMVAILLSGGLLIPWAQIRWIRYRLSCLKMALIDDPNQSITTTQKKLLTIVHEKDTFLDLNVGI
ncbi:MAG: YjgN family protein [Magnetococcus sp. DMHC-6]